MVKDCMVMNMTTDECILWLKNMRKDMSDNFGYSKEEAEALEMAISALKREQWIPCSERMPDEHESILAERYGTDNWRKWMWRNTSDMVIATIQLENGGKSVRQAWTHDGKWYVDSILNVIVVAWMPLPEPYKEND